MAGSDILLTIAEVSVAFAGFASVVVVFQQRTERWSALDYRRLWRMLEASLSALFFCFLPLVLHHFGVAERATWRASSLTLALYMGAAAVYYMPRLLREVAPAALSPSLHRTVIGGSSIVFLALLTNASGIVSPPGFGPFLAALVWQLAVSGLMFVRLVLTRPPPG